MKDEIIKQVLEDHLVSPEKENFNSQIVKRLNVKENKKHKALFDEKTILNWFLATAVFVLFFYLQQEANLDMNAILIGSIISAIPLYALLFNKIYSIKKS